MIDLNKAKKVANQSAILAGNFFKEFNEDVLVTLKKDAVDVQTNADIKAEKIIVKKIQESFPNHNIDSEEIGFIDNQSEYTWTVDPLDGTRQYRFQLPLYGAMVSLQNKKELLVSAMYLPGMNLHYSATVKEKSQLNNNNISVNSESKLEKSFLLMRTPYKKLGIDVANLNFKILNQIALNCYKLVEIYLGNLSIALVGQGFASGYVNLLPKRHWHDYSAGILIAKQAGAKITDKNGNKLKLGDLSKGLVVTNGHIHDQLLSIINQ